MVVVIYSVSIYIVSSWFLIIAKPHKNINLNDSIKQSGIKSGKSIIFSTFAERQLIMKNTAPKARKEAHNITTNGHTRIDNYFWMNQRDHADVLAYINAENQYTQQYFEDTQKIQETILNEFDQNIDPNDKGAPFSWKGNGTKEKILQIKTIPCFSI